MIAVKISDKNSVQQPFETAPGQRLLQAGLAARLGLPYECATGSCGNCKATIVNSAVTAAGVCLGIVLHRYVSLLDAASLDDRVKQYHKDDFSRAGFQKYVAIGKP